MNSKSMFSSKKTIILIVIAILLIIYIYTVYQSYKSYRTSSPYLIQGTIEGTSPKTIEAYKIPQPTDGQYGQEFTYSCWLYIKDTNFVNATETCNMDNGMGPLAKLIFNKGSKDLFKTQVNGQTVWHYPTLSSPGVYLYPNTNKLHIRFNTYDTNSPYKSADVGNIPLNKWFLLTIVLIGNSVDIYINNMLKKREKMGVVKLNYGDVNINSFGGFNGYLSNLRYYNRAVEYWEIDENYQLGANMKQPVENIQQIANLSPNYFFTTGYPNSNFGASSTTTTSTTTTSSST
jgi:hypothetical protein